VYFVVATALQLFAAQEPPADWVDADTGHRVIRLGLRLAF